MHELLRNADGPLSFVVTVANWDHSEVKALCVSPFARAQLLVPPEEQKWFDGASARRTSSELLVVVLQNSAAAEDSVFAATSAKMAALHRSCVGEAQLLGPRKKALRLRHLSRGATPHSA